MNYHQLLTKAISDCQEVYDSTSSFSTSRYIVEEMADIVDYYLETYPELISDQENFRSNIFHVFLIDENQYYY